MDERYIKELSKFKLLSTDEVFEIYERIKTGDTKAISVMVESNLRMVIHIAKNYSILLQNQSAVTMEDLISEGNIGLIKAVNEYDISVGSSFYSYAMIWIKKYIIEYINGNINTIRVPVNHINKGYRINKLVSSMEQQKMDSVSKYDIEELNLFRPSEINHYFNGSKTTRLDDEMNIEDVLETQKDNERLNKVIRYALNKLTKKQRLYIQMYFGIDHQKLTPSEIIKAFGTSKQAVFDLKTKALNNLNNIIKEIDLTT